MMLPGGSFSCAARIWRSARSGLPSSRLSPMMKRAPVPLWSFASDAHTASDGTKSWMSVEPPPMRTTMGPEPKEVR
jgi:hypothetical protein